MKGKRSAPSRGTLEWVHRFIYYKGYYFEFFGKYMYNVVSLKRTEQCLMSVKHVYQSFWKPVNLSCNQKLSLFKDIRYKWIYLKKRQPYVKLWCPKHWYLVCWADLGNQVFIEVKKIREEFVWLSNYLRTNVTTTETASFPNSKKLIPQKLINNSTINI